MLSKAKLNVKKLNYYLTHLIFFVFSHLYQFSIFIENWKLTMSKSVIRIVKSFDIWERM